VYAAAATDIFPSALRLRLTSISTTRRRARRSAVVPYVEGTRITWSNWAASLVVPMVVGVTGPAAVRAQDTSDANNLKE